ncbi:MAG: type II CRISPR-associated endonuclease Cas1 [Thermodesulfovibrionales bacterium]|nr:type II CRISPR-associated endonuclease Cas1 [Thermodesulfovibrionales bacterium]
MPLTDRIIDISECGADLSVRHSQLVISSSGAEITVPMAEISVIVISHPAVRISHAVLSGMCSSGGICVFCTEKHLPAGMLLPIEGNSVQAERFVKQAQSPLPTRKKVWKHIAREKILSQGRLLKKLTGDDKGLNFMADKVRAGDPSNLEAQAGRRYWKALFGNAFRRNPYAEDQNRLLNYGYAVLRAATARAICSSGLHPSIGLHHHNKYDPFCLADDLMEPFRPIVDEAAYQIAAEKGPTVALDKETKKTIIKSIVDKRFDAQGESRTLFDVMTRVTASLADVYLETRNNIFLPEF